MNARGGSEGEASDRAGVCYSASYDGTPSFHADRLDVVFAPPNDPSSTTARVAATLHGFLLLARDRPSAIPPTLVAIGTSDALVTVLFDRPPLPFLLSLRAPDSWVHHDPITGADARSIEFVAADLYDALDEPHDVERMPRTSLVLEPEPGARHRGERLDTVASPHVIELRWFGDLAGPEPLEPPAGLLTRLRGYAWREEH
ncbi:hypothetical protein GCM10011490_02190 [Pseudoclavibacter endophyticus]|uniref:Uncharacterized protein n=1 Tax=Pseudoclavibacter endophyticus TaxID=1778590 RepID=A0A6H9WRI5_9MICO|nr:hypothetical protein [Pseudoclavibacter endophyticus]KAB1650241.1 hypothetical protein F8O04_08615 [Pseudoclavibacter endophyticus]GGA55926.1 hypothetical protein GCM10011490_02190 [Pseudoclavibacter endophyticus]